MNNFRDKSNGNCCRGMLCLQLNRVWSLAPWSSKLFQAWLLKAGPKITPEHGQVWSPQTNNSYSTVYAYNNYNMTDIYQNLKLHYFINSLINSVRKI